MTPARLLVVASVIALSAACGGSVAGGPDGSSSSSGGSSSGGSSSGGSSGTSGGTCTSSPVAGSRACVPGTARAGAPLRIAVDATDGCLGCFAKLDACTVDVVGDRITVAMTATTCEPTTDRECPAVCMIPSTSCDVPPLAAGEYTVEVAGEGSRSGLAPRTIVVAADATETSCELPSPGTPPAPLDGSKYARACSTDEDCVRATVGNLCQPCACPNTAIAKAAAAEYEADRRARSSQCEPQGAVVCAACAPMNAKCEIQPDALTGTCTLVAGF